MIRITDQPFDPWSDLARFSGDHPTSGAVASFVGLVRDLDDGRHVTALTLEHYPGMAETQLSALEIEATRRWAIEAILIVHRVGRILRTEPIVLVAVAASHRGPALETCQYLIDWLKTEAPIWKLEESSDGERWIDAKATDAAARDRWQR